MSDIVISTENLSKQYRLGVISHGTLTRDLQSWWARARGKDDPNSRINIPTQGQARGNNERFWALRDLSFEVERGSKIGIIGRNGAGKSTLLKVLSRITAPSSGKAKIKGRVASLLEVGTGFHPELTGRENIYLNGAILGMSKIETKKKLDEIVSFAGVEKFLDTPVKRYSSGMYVRLAFAVAAHLEPEILIIDEVLAVGDAEFQKKCLGKMDDVSKTGRTVLFVSHNMQAIRSLCPKSMLLNKGEIVTFTATEETLSAYNQSLRNIEIGAETSINNEQNRRGSGAVRFTSVEVKDVESNRRFDFGMGETIRFEMSYETFKEMPGLAVYIGLRSGMTRELVTSAQHVLSTKKISAGTKGTVVVEFPDTYVRPGEYPLYIYISDTDLKSYDFDVLDDLISPLIITSDGELNHSNFNPKRPVGYFSLPSRIVLNEILS